MKNPEMKQNLLKLVNSRELLNLNVNTIEFNRITIEPGFKRLGFKGIWI
jgi:hypothetical protein